VSRVLVVDDLRTFTFPAVYARTSAEGLEAVRLARCEGLDELWLDFDLGEVNGMVDVAEPIVDLLAQWAHDGEPLEVGRVVVHSANPVGAARMMLSLQRWGYRAERVDAAWFIKRPAEN
jgi:hypothetical protein